MEQYRCLALSVVRHLGYAGDEDLEQVALLALVKAIDRFDPDRGARLSSYAVPTILGDLKHYLRDNSRLVRPSRAAHDLHAAVIASERELTSVLGRRPTLAEIAEALGVELEAVVEAVAMDETCVPCSLDGVASQEDDDCVALDEWVGEEDPGLAEVETRLAWEEVLGTLDPRLRRVIELRYYDELTQTEAARRLGVSQMHISRLERRALARLRQQTGQAILSIQGLC